MRVQIPADKQSGTVHPPPRPTIRGPSMALLVASPLSELQIRRINVSRETKLSGLGLAAAACAALACLYAYLPALPRSAVQVSRHYRPSPAFWPLPRVIGLYKEGVVPGLQNQGSQYRQEQYADQSRPSFQRKSGTKHGSDNITGGHPQAELPQRLRRWQEPRQCCDIASHIDELGQC